jgi:tetratricopeptide (TPR) repeat protein
VPVREVLSDARTNGGNSGSPVVNTAGEVVGVHFAFKPWATGVVRHVSVVELQAYLKTALPMVEPKTGEQFLARAKRRFDAGRLDGAAADATTALAKNPKLADALAIRGQVFLAKNDPQTALEDFNAAVKLAPENYDLRIFRGRANRAVGKTADAISDFSTAARINPEQWVGYNERGLTNFRTNNFAEAAEDFGRAIDASPKNSVLWGNRADARSRLEKFDLAAADWAQAAELAPWNAYYPNGQGLALLKARKYDAAAEAFALAVNASNGAPLYLGNMSEALRLAGKHDLAVKGFTKAIDAWQKLVADGVKIAPVKIAADYAARGKCRIALKQYKDAAEDLTKALDLTDRKVAWYFADRAAAFDGLGEKSAADADRKAAEALGYKFDKPVQPKAENAFAGIWTGTCNVNGVRLTQVITLNANGTFHVTATARGPLGTEVVTDTGTWSATKTKLTINGKAFGTVVRTYEWSDGAMKVEVEELGGITITFTKSK